VSDLRLPKDQNNVQHFFNRKPVPPGTQGAPTPPPPGAIGPKPGTPTPPPVAVPPPGQPKPPTLPPPATTTPAPVKTQELGPPKVWKMVLSGRINFPKFAA